MSSAGQASPPGRPAQRRRTRGALLAAAAAMMRAGQALPSVAEVAAAADVSRRTAYRYFPTAEQLATEAVLETLAPHLDPAVTDTHRPGDVRARVAATVRRMQESAVAHEPLLRAMIRLTIEQTPPADGARPPSARGSRRVRWLDDAARPIRARIGKAAYQRLLSALSLCVGAEALIALRDARGLGTQDAVEVSVWAAGALVAAALSESEAAGSSRRARPRRPVPRRPQGS